MKTPTAFNVKCDECERENLTDYVEVISKGNVRSLMGSFFGETDSAAQFCSLDCAATWAAAQAQAEDG